MPGHFTRIIGPLAECETRVWEQLVNFDCWPQWMHEVESVSRQDDGDPGRGSVLLLNRRLRQHSCRITHWHPLNRVDLNIHATGKHIGYSFRLVATQDSEQIELRLAMELEFHGLHRLFRHLLLTLEKRRARRMLDRFGEYMRRV